MIKQMDEYEMMLAEEQLFKVKLFTYPDWQTPSAIFDYEDLENDDTIMVLCVKAKKDEEHRQQDTVYVWHGADHKVSQEQQKNFLDKCIEQYFGSQASKSKLKILQEYSAQEGDVFMQFFE